MRGFVEIFVGADSLEFGLHTLGLGESLVETVFGEPGIVIVGQLILYGLDIGGVHSTFESVELVVPRVLGACAEREGDASDQKSP